jgi:alkylation response protein AidB-like acyl-CoA dehydrogenase
MHAAIEVGIARAAFEETLERVRVARPGLMPILIPPLKIP